MAAEMASDQSLNKGKYHQILEEAGMDWIRKCRLFEQGLEEVMSA